MSDNFDNATLRLGFAKAMISTLSIFMAESQRINHDPNLLADSLSGVELLIDDACKLLFS